MSKQRVCLLRLAARLRKPVEPASRSALERFVMRDACFTKALGLRNACLRRKLCCAPTPVLPITRAILELGRCCSALEVYRAQYELAALHRAVERLFTMVDLLLLPTAGTIYEITAIAASQCQSRALHQLR
jgi:Asp-tRNA(Asn)/Glu-tRNA(Gln) amidotransferase A subunit family amidase